MEDFLVYFYQNKEVIFIISLSIFLGVEVISNVPSVLHTPLMSGANAISGVIIIGGIIAAPVIFLWSSRWLSDFAFRINMDLFVAQGTQVGFHPVQGLSLPEAGNLGRVHFDPYRFPGMPGADVAEAQI